MNQLSTEVTGVRETLRTLNKIDPQLKKAAVASLKLAGAAMVAVARSTYPDEAPLSGMASKGRLRYQPGRVRSQVSIQVGGRAPRNAKAYPVVTLRQSNAAAQLYSMAGMSDNRYSRATNEGQRKFSQNLEDRWGKAQRGMWKERRMIRQLSEDYLEKAADLVAKNINRELRN